MAAGYIDISLYRYLYRWTELTSCLLGLLGAAWIMRKYWTLPFLRTFPGFMILCMAWADVATTSFYTYDGITGIWFDYGQDFSYDVQFAINQLWDWAQLSACFISFTLVVTIVYILYFKGNTATLQRRKWIMALFLIFGPVLLYFGTFSVICKVPLHLGGRNLDTYYNNSLTKQYLDLSTPLNTTVLPECYGAGVSNYSNPAENAYFAVMFGITGLNLVVSLVVWIQVSGKNLKSFFRLADPPKTKPGNMITMRLLLAFSLATFVTWTPYCVISAIFRFSPSDKNPINKLTNQVLSLIHIAISPSRGLWHALAI
ncbi:hypothetical protein HDU91_006596, partial [Kappamyces sp. JEL0680]